MTEEIRYADGEAYLVISAVENRWGDWSLQGFHTRKTKPSVDSNQVALKLSLRLPVALFEKPLLAAAIRVEGDVPSIEVTPETVSTIQDVIRSTAGLDVELTVVEP